VPVDTTPPAQRWHLGFQNQDCQIRNRELSGYGGGSARVGRVQALLCKREPACWCCSTSGIIITTLTILVSIRSEVVSLTVVVSQDGRLCIANVTEESGSVDE